MRVLFLTLYPEQAASPRYRVHQFLPALEARGIECTVASAVSLETWQRHQSAEAPRARQYHLEEIRRRITQLLGARKYDLVVVQKGLASVSFRLLPTLLKRYARRFVIDFDDAVHKAPPAQLQGFARSLENRRQLFQLSALADCTIAGNKWLASEVKVYAKRVEVVPTVVDTQRFVPAASPPERFTLGWIGSPSTTPYAQIAADCFREAEDLGVILCGADPKRVHWPEAKLTPWRIDTEVETLQRFSVGIMPTPKEQWVRGKCGLKALQYGACGIPTIATPYGVAHDIIRDGETGLLADTKNDWRAAVDKLRDDDLRARLGATARDFVVNEYSLEAWAPRLADLLESVA